MDNFPSLTYDPNIEIKETAATDPVNRTKPENGPVHTSLRISRVPRKFSFTLGLLTAQDKDLLVRFEDQKSKYGAVIFTWQNFYEAYHAPARLPGTAYLYGQIVRPATANGRSYRCTSAGTSGSGTPSWPTSINATVTDGTVTWRENTYQVRQTKPWTFEMIAPGYWSCEMELEEA